MTKELTPLEVSNQLKDFVLEFVKNGLDRMFINGSFDIIETALKRLENYDKNEDFNKDVINYAFLSEEDKIKKLKALKIIKEKEVNVEWLLETESVEEYNESLYIDLTQAEYDLLREVLK